MKYMFLFSILLLSFSAYSNDLSSLVGEWEQFDTGSEKKYTYFKYNADRSGVFATVRGNGKPSLDTFLSEQVEVNDGIAVIDFEESEKYKAKLVVAGYNKSINGFVTGMLYMYIKKKKDWEIFNTIFIRLLPKEELSFISNVNDLHKKLQKSENAEKTGKPGSESNCF